MTPESAAPRYDAARWLFLRLFGATAAIAFASLLVQLRGLVGAHGLLPVADFLARAREVLGASAPLRLPTLLWFGASDAALLAIGFAGLAAALLVALELVEGPALVAIWTCYLSLSVAGQDFLSFQWDALLLETALVTLFWAPWRVRPGRPPAPAGAIGRWLLWGLIGKLMFLSGATKLASGDPTWRDLTAMTFHYQTQPLPDPASWYAHHLPLAVHRGEALVTFAIEVGLPLLLLVPWRATALRRVAAGGFVALQLLIGATGNYGFFNLLVIALALPLVDDDLWRRLLPERLFRRAARIAADRPGPPPVRKLAAALAAAVGVVSIVALAAELQSTAGRPLPAPESAVLEAVAPLRSINGYGLFRRMTTERPQVVLETSDDGSTWREIPWRYQAVELARRPVFLPLHMPRLDWQLWFAGLSPRRAAAWLIPLLRGVLEGREEVLDLLPRGALGATPPSYVRLRLYRYRFTTAAERAATGNWWAREFAGDLTAPLRRADFDR